MLPSVFQSWTGPEKLLALDELIDSCEPTQVKHMMQVIEPQFQRDFISLLPKEVSPWTSPFFFFFFLSSCRQIIPCSPVLARLLLLLAAAHPGLRRRPSLQTLFSNGRARERNATSSPALILSRSSPPPHHLALFTVGVLFFFFLRCVATDKTNKPKCHTDGKST